MSSRVLFICGSINQTTQLHQIADQLPEVEPFFTPYYGGPILDFARKAHLCEFSIGGTKLTRRCLDYLERHQLNIDLHGRRGDYDLAVTCSDVVVPDNVREIPILLVQEGIPDPDNIFSYLVRKFPSLPHWIAGTATTGLSHAYDRFCVASEGYKRYFAGRGVDERKLVVTGIPNFDNCAAHLNNDFPHHGYALVCTSDARETLKLDKRSAFIKWAVEKSGGRPMIFKLHPNENVKRATAEINRWVPGALVFSAGDTNAMIANSEVLITQYSSVVFVGLALGKECHSYHRMEELVELVPEQNREAAQKIAQVCRELLGTPALWQQDEVAA